MGATSFLDHGIRRFESGMSKSVLQLVGLWGEKLQVWCTPPIGSTLIPHLITTPPACQSHLLLNHPPLLIHFMSISFPDPIHEVGSEVQMAVYSTGYP